MPDKKSATTAKNDRGDIVIRITFPYSYDTVDQIRSLPGRLYHKEEQCWSAPIFTETLEKLYSWGFILDEKLRDILLNEKNKALKIINSEIEGLKGELYGFQKEGVAFIESKNGRCLIADEMGLGKTIQALAWLQMHPRKRPALITVPASLKLKWEYEIRRWMQPQKVQIISGINNNKTIIDVNGEIFIINYDILYHWLDELREINPKIIILDEIHYIKSNQARRTKSAKIMSKGIPHIIGLSGTPIINRPIEAYNFLKIIIPELFPNRWYYAERYCGAHHNRFGWRFNGATHTSELHEILKGTIMLRRLKKDVLKELPEKTWSFIPIELDNYKEYREAEKNFIEYIRKIKGNDAAIKAAKATAFISIETLKQLAVKGKLNHVVEWIEDFLEVEDKLVIFATHHFVIDFLVNKFVKIAVKLDGRDSPKLKDKVQKQFQNNPNIKLFIGGTKSAGIGIDLFASSNVAFIELPWTPGDIDQASDRCHRIGQSKKVTVYFLLAHETIEEKISKILDTKRKVLDSVHDGKATEKESLLMELIHEYEK